MYPKQFLYNLLHKWTKFYTRQGFGKLSVRNKTQNYFKNLWYPQIKCVILLIQTPFPFLQNEYNFKKLIFF